MTAESIRKEYKNTRIYPLLTLMLINSRIFKPVQSMIDVSMYVRGLRMIIFMFNCSFFSFSWSSLDDKWVYTSG